MAVFACHFLRLDPARFWQLPFRDLDTQLKALRLQREHPAREELNQLYRQFPDIEEKHK
ncbi:MAG: phage tail assembly chaperone [Nitratireductor sp.]